MKKHLSRDIKLTISDTFQNIDNDEMPIYGTEKNAMYIYDKEVKFIDNDEYLILEKNGEQIKFKKAY